MFELLFAAVLAAADPAPRFELNVRGEPLRVGAVQSLGPETVSLEAGAKAPVADLVSLRRVSALLPSRASGAALELASGECLAGTVAALDDSGLSFNARSVTAVNEARPLKVPVTTVGRIWLGPGEVSRERHPAFFADKRSKDVLVYANGDSAEGTLVGIDGGKKDLEWEADGKRRQVPLANVTAVAFNTRVARVRRPKGIYFHTVLRDGSRLDLVDLSIDGGQVRGLTAFRERVQFQLDELLAADASQGCAVYLSELKPVRYDYRPYNSESFGWAADRDLRGGPLQLQSPTGTSTFDRGLALHGECRLRFALDGGFRTFEAVVGLDPDLGARGSVEILVLADGDKRAQIERLTLASGPSRLQVDVRKCRELTLVVKWGDGGNVGDYVNWGDARLIRE